MEEEESKDNESDEEATDKSQKPNSSHYVTLCVTLSLILGGRTTTVG